LSADIYINNYDRLIAKMENYVKIRASDINRILKKYGYRLVFDKIHADSELKIYGDKEPNFDTTKYLTIKDKNGIVVGRFYRYNTGDSIPLNNIVLDEEDIVKTAAFFKFFVMDNSKNVLNELSRFAEIDIDVVNADIIRNNVYQGKRSEY